MALSYLETLPSRPVGEQATLAELRAHLGAPLGEEGVEPAAVLRDLAAGAEPGLIGSAGPRYFGFVIGGSLPAALGADWLTSTWDQNPGLYAVSPAAAVVEEIAAAWILDLLGLPAGASVGFVTGCQMAHVTALAAARHALLA
ncbi:MAG TPA: aspartate aminotransferase family protein, partial [Thermoanaerobaculia bacterium]|nr:aspartate aminotransferase family protein [Thermoanaerobaculia bacterium]